MHKAIVSRVDRVIPISGADKIQEVVVLGEHLVVSKDISVGDIGILFPVDLQLSDQFCHENNLFRDATKNKDKGKSGFFEDNRRVRAQPFLKVKSSGLFMPLSSVDYAGVSLTENDLGLEFDVLNGIKICEKYISVEQKRKIANSQTKSVKKAEYPLFDRHVDTEQVMHKIGEIPVGSYIHITPKLHGTSGRVALKQKIEDLSWWKRLVNKVIPLFSEGGAYTLVVGTRNTILDSPSHEGFYGNEQFRFNVAKQFEPYLENGMCIYHEIVGYTTSGKAIMPSHSVRELKDKAYLKKYGNTVDFTYGCEIGECKAMVYRITREDVNGNNIDMSQVEMEAWCKDRNLWVAERICDSFVYDGDRESLEEKIISLSERGALLAEDYINPVSYGEGVVVRVESHNFLPKFYKYKNYAFKVGEGILPVDDMESVN